MSLELKFIGKSIVELHFNNGRGELVDDISNLDGIVSEEFIQNLYCIAEMLRSHNDEREECLQNKLNK
jgi:hypothetical protein